MSFIGRLSDLKAAIINAVFAKNCPSIRDSCLFCCYFFQAFSLLFLTLAFCSDLICLMFLPVHWLFFAASTYVWVQFVWHTGNSQHMISSILNPLEAGICLKTPAAKFAQGRFQCLHLVKPGGSDLKLHFEDGELPGI